MNNKSGQLGQAFIFMMVLGVIAIAMFLALTSLSNVAENQGELNVSGPVILEQFDNIGIILAIVAILVALGLAVMVLLIVVRGGVPGIDDDLGDEEDQDEEDDEEECEWCKAEMQKGDDVYECDECGDETCDKCVFETDDAYYCEDCYDELEPQPKKKKPKPKKIVPRKDPKPTITEKELTRSKFD